MNHKQKVHPYITMAVLGAGLVFSVITIFLHQSIQYADTEFSASLASRYEIAE